MIKIHNNIATREELPSFLVGLKEEVFISKALWKK